MKCWLWLLGILTIASSAQADAERVIHAIVIGNNAPPVGHPELAALHYADDDASRYYEVLRHASAHVDILSVLDARTQERFQGLAARTQPPTRSALDRALARATAAMQRDAEAGRRPVLILTFSGHGAIDEHGEPYLALADQNLTRTDLYEHILPSLADVQVHLIIDACHAGATVGVRGAFDVEADATTVSLNESEARSLAATQSLDRFPNVGAIVATSADQEAHEWSRIESGVFTHEVLSALLGAADVNGDLRVEYSEVEVFVASANRRVSDPRARPQVIAHAPRADRRAVLMDLSALREVTLLRGRVGEVGRFHVELENGLRWLEAHLAADTWATLVLPAATRAHVRTTEREAAVPAGPAPRLESLSFVPVATSQRGSVDDAYRVELFAVPYDRAYYAGYVDSAQLPSVQFEPRRAELDGLPAARASERRRRAALASLTTAGAALAGSIVWGGLALQAKRESHDNRDAEHAAELTYRFERRVTVSAACAGVAALGIALGFHLWPRAPELAVSSDGTGFRAQLTVRR